jgi:MFS family permease
VQVLLVNQLTINISFYMLIPYLAGHLADDLSLAAWIVGLVLAVRIFSQQGFFLVGGSLSDRIGRKPVIIAGCALRAVGFALFGVMDPLPGLIVASVLTGLAGALFSPAVRAYLAHAAQDRRTDAFALFSVFAESGALVGPLVGIILLNLDFRLICLLASGLFAALTVLQALHLPKAEAEDISAQSKSPVLQDWREAVTNLSFMLFTLGMMGRFALSNQMYLGLALEVRRLTGNDAGVGLLFAFSSVLVILGQLHVTSFSRARWRPPQAIAIGLMLKGLAFVPPIFTAMFLWDSILLDPYGAGLGGIIATWTSMLVVLIPLLVCVTVLTIGGMVSQPFVMSMIPDLGARRLVGTYFGLYYLAQGIGAALGNLAVGAAFDVSQRTGLTSLPWLLMILIGLASAARIAMLDRHKMLVKSPITS